MDYGFEGFGFVILWNFFHRAMPCKSNSLNASGPTLHWFPISNSHSRPPCMHFTICISRPIQHQLHFISMWVQMDHFASISHTAPIIHNSNRGPTLHVPRSMKIKSLRSPKPWSTNLVHQNLDQIQSNWIFLLLSRNQLGLKSARQEIYNKLSTILLNSNKQHNSFN